MKILCIDFGRVRCGIAETDPLQIIASPVDFMETDKIYSFLKNYLSNNQVETIVIGKPLQLFGDKEVSLEYHIEQFILKLKELFPSVMIDRIDERLSSKMAQRSLIESGMKKKKRQQKGQIDVTAATILLQDYLILKKNKNI